MSFWNRLWNTFRPSRLDEELSREMETHLSEMQDDAVKEGLTHEEARRAARVQFGSAVSWREETRDRNLLSGLVSLLQDVRYATRQLRQSPSFGVPAVLLLALGIGANIAIFTLLHSIVIASLPIPHADRIIVLLDRHAGGGSSPPSWLDQRDFRERNRVFESVGAFDFRNTVLLQSVQKAVRVSGSRVTPDYMTTLGAVPLAGRLFTQAEGQPGNENVAIVREDFWRSEFGGDPAILGRTIRIDGSKCTIIGILPRFFTFPRNNTVLWIPLVPTPLQRNDRSWHGFPMVGRMKAGVTLAEAYANLNSIMLRLSREYPKEDADRTTVNLSLLSDWTVGQMRERLLILQYAALAVFLMTCANVSSLVLARCSVRGREFAMRAALGASRLRLIRQRLTEILVLGVVSCGVSAIVAWAGVKFLVYLYGAALPRAAEVGADVGLLWFALAVIVATVLLLGLATAFHREENDFEATLRQGAGTLGTRRSARWRMVLVSVQAACALTLVCGSFELLQSFQNLRHVRSGVNSSHLLTLHVALPENDYPNAARCNQFYAALTHRVSQIGGVESAASINMLPIQQAGYNGDVDVPGLPPHSASFFAEYRWITGDYFRTMGIPILRGRDFLPEELSGARRAAIINETMARTLWKDRNPVGWTIQLNESAAVNDVAFTVIGVAQDVHQSGLDLPPRSEIEFPLSTMPEPITDQSMVLRTTLPEVAILASLRDEVKRLESGAAIFDVNPMRDVLNGSYSVTYTRLLSILLSTFAVLSLFIAAFGLYGISSYAVTERRRELAIRSAIGASGARLMRHVLQQSAYVLGVGLLLGGVGAFFATRSLESALFGVSGLPILTVLSAAAVLSVAAGLGISIPTFRAGRIDPVQILKQQ